MSKVDNDALFLVANRTLIFLRIINTTSLSNYINQDRWIMYITLPTLYQNIFYSKIDSQLGINSSNLHFGYWLKKVGKNILI